MGQNKAYLKLGNLTLLERSIDLLKSICSWVFISGNYSSSVVSVPDCETVKEKGPLGGIFSCLDYLLKNDIGVDHFTFIIPVDMPSISENVLRQLLVIAKNDLFSRQAYCFEKHELPILLKINSENYQVLKEILSSPRGDFSMRNFLNKIAAKEFSGQREQVLVNTNTPNEWENYLKMRSFYEVKN